jgi:hypothetical protein
LRLRARPKNFRVLSAPLRSRCSYGMVANVLTLIGTNFAER